MKDWFIGLCKDKFKRYLILSLVSLGIILLFYGGGGGDADSDLVVHFFYQPGCHFCSLQKLFNEKLMQEYPEVKWSYHDITNPNEASLFRQMATEKGIQLNQLGTPTTFIGEQYFIGFKEGASEDKIRAALEDFIAGKKGASNIEKHEFTPVVDLPFLGEKDVMKYSLPMLAVVLGLVDGFNPCAMWVLVYLISLIVGLNDKRKIWLLVGSFIFASGVLYFLFMTAWLNVFLYIGYLKPLTLAIGLFAFGVGILDVRSYVKHKEEMVCEVGGADSRKKTMTRIKEIITSPLSIGTVIGIIGLAFVVNSIEFVCSSAIPTIFTQVLALSELSGLEYYGYILLYDFFFVLDDLIIFGLAVFAVNRTVGKRYVKYSKLIGGIILAMLGILLVFFPELLR